MWKWWPWRRITPPAVEEAQSRLEHTAADDVRVDRVVERTNRLIRENNLAPYVMKALGIRP